MIRILGKGTLVATVVIIGAVIIMSVMQRKRAPAAAEYQKIKLTAGSAGLVLGTAPSCGQDTKEMISKVGAFIDSFNLTPSQKKEYTDLMYTGVGVSAGFAIQVPPNKIACEANKDLMNMVINALK